jgi:hypothetical protein
MKNNIILKSNKFLKRYARGICLLMNTALLIYWGLQPVSAQDHHSVSIRASAQVIEQAEIELITIKDLDLDLKQAVGGLITISATTAMEAGKIMVKGIPGAYIRVTYLPEVILLNATGTGSITLHYKVFGYPDDNQIASEPIDAVERMMRINPEGLYYLWVGGLVNVVSASPGSYQGEFTIEIEYL